MTTNRYHFSLNCAAMGVIENTTSQAADNSLARVGKSPEMEATDHDD